MKKVEILDRNENKITKKDLKKKRRYIERQEWKDGFYVDTHIRKNSSIIKIEVWEKADKYMKKDHLYREYLCEENVSRDWNDRRGYKLPYREQYYSGGYPMFGVQYREKDFWNWQTIEIDLFDNEDEDITDPIIRVVFRCNYGNEKDVYFKKLYRIGFLGCYDWHTFREAGAECFDSYCIQQVNNSQCKALAKIMTDYYSMTNRAFYWKYHKKTIKSFKELNK